MTLPIPSSIPFVFSDNGLFWLNSLFLTDFSSLNCSLNHRVIPEWGKLHDIVYKTKSI